MPFSTNNKFLHTHQVFDLMGHPGGEREKSTAAAAEQLINSKADLVSFDSTLSSYTYCAIIFEHEIQSE